MGGGHIGPAVEPGARPGAARFVRYRWGELYGQFLPIACRKPPLEFPELTLDMCWHQRFDEDPGHCWFREVVGDALRSTMAELGVALLPG